MVDTDIFNERELKKDRVLLILQLALYLGWVGVGFVTSDNLQPLQISRLALITCSFLIKLYRQYTRHPTLHHVVDTQLSFSVIYLLTAFQMVFQYKSLQYLISTPLQAVLLSTTIITNINYSMFTNEKSLKIVQFIVYSIGLAVRMCWDVKTAVLAIEVFYGVEGGAYLQSFILLTLTTRITIEAKILQKLYASYKARRKSLQQQSKEKKQIQIQLAETLHSRN